MKEPAGPTNEEILSPRIGGEYMGIEETLRLHASQKLQPKVSPRESELLPNAYYNVDEDQNVIDGINLMNRGVVNPYTVYFMRKAFIN
jgi:hypothetical protein